MSEKTMRGGVPRFFHSISDTHSHSIVTSPLSRLIPPGNPKEILEWASNNKSPLTKDLDYFYRSYEMYRKDFRWRDSF